MLGFCNPAGVMTGNTDIVEAAAKPALIAKKATIIVGKTKIIWLKNNTKAVE